MALFSIQIWWFCSLPPFVACSSRTNALLERYRIVTEKEKKKMNPFFSHHSNKKTSSDHEKQVYKSPCFLVFFLCSSFHLSSFPSFSSLNHLSLPFFTLKNGFVTFVRFLLGWKINTPFQLLARSSLNQAGSFDLGVFCDYFCCLQHSQTVIFLPSQPGAHGVSLFPMDWFYCWLWPPALWIFQRKSGQVRWRFCFHYVWPCYDCLLGT